MGLHVRAALLSALPLMRRGKAPYCSTLRRPASSLQHRRPPTLLHAAGFSTLPSSSAPTTATPNSSPGMSDELREFLAAEKKKIVTFKVQGEVFHGSKLILAMRSSVFARMLYGSSGEKKPEDITIEVDTDPAAFKMFLHYVDTDSSPDMDDLDGDVDEETVKHLLVIADKYGMEHIKMACERALSQRLQVKNVATTLALAHKHDCRNLKDACTTFINSSDRHAVISSKGYADLKTECLDVFVQLWEKSAKSRKN